MPATTATGGQPDDDLLQLVDEAFESVEGTYDRLQAVETYFRERTDRRAVFLTVYAEMTGAIERQIGTGFFEDPEWVADYLIAFANEYREALLAFERSDYATVPEPWQMAFRTSVGGDTLVIQDALLGINAHINYDLAHTLRQVGITPDRSRKRADHKRINTIIKRIIDTVQVALVSVYSAEGVSSLDAVLDRVDEHLMLFGIREGRTYAWRNAALLTGCSWEPVCEFVRWRLSAFASGCSSVILELDVAEPLLAELEAVERPGPPLGEFEREFRAQLRC